VIYAGTRGYLDGVPVTDVRRFEAGLLDWFRTRHSDLLDGIVSTGNITDTDAFEGGLKAYAAQFVTSEAGYTEPEPQPQGPASSRLVDADTTLPEAEIEREDA
jgi:F-type H+-transporting ATPase subunit alpha